MPNFNPPPPFYFAGGYIYRPNFTQAAQIVLRDFRDGLLGKFNLDMDLLVDETQGKMSAT